MRLVEKSALPYLDWKFWRVVIFEGDLIRNVIAGVGSAKYNDLKMLTWGGKVLEYPESVSEKDPPGMEFF